MICQTFLFFPEASEWMFCLKQTNKKVIHSTGYKKQLWLIYLLQLPVAAYKILGKSKKNLSAWGTVENKVLWGAQASLIITEESCFWLEWKKQQWRVQRWEKEYYWFSYYFYSLSVWVPILSCISFSLYIHVCYGGHMWCTF